LAARVPVEKLLVLPISLLPKCTGASGPSSIARRRKRAWSRCLAQRYHFGILQHQGYSLGHFVTSCIDFTGADHGKIGINYFLPLTRFSARFIA
jgi:hypothetical protein